MMKKTVFTALALACVAFPAFASGVEGVWKTEPDDGAYAYVTIAPCGPTLCGVISRTFSAEGEYASENIGKQILIDMSPNDKGGYDGKLWRPSNGKTYTGNMKAEGDKLNLKGCVLGGLICGGQTWTRVSK